MAIYMDRMRGYAEAKKIDFYFSGANSNRLRWIIHFVYIRIVVNTLLSNAFNRCRAERYNGAFHLVAT